MPHESSCNTQEYIRVRVEEAGETASSSSAAPTSTPHRRATSPWMGNLRVSLPVLRLSAAASPDDGEDSCILMAASLRLKLDARVRTIYVDIIPATTAEDQAIPLLEPVQLDLQVPACEVDPTRRYVGAAVHKQVEPEVDVDEESAHHFLRFIKELPLEIEEVLLLVIKAWSYKILLLNTII
eukprot:s2247_g1.t1